MCQKVKRDPRRVKSQKSADLNSTYVQGTAIGCNDLQIGSLKNRVGFKKQKITEYRRQYAI